MKYLAEYIWIDGNKPTAWLRSKTRVLDVGQEPPFWGFDGSSTMQATGQNSDCVLQPVAIFDDPLRVDENPEVKNKLVMCEVLNTDGEPHESNNRAACLAAANKYAKHEPWFGVEQEYTLMEGARPLEWPDNGFPPPQGGYYCGVGADEVFGREVVEDHLDACVAAGLGVSGINAEVMPSQWEFQIGPLGPTEVADQTWAARWLLFRIAAEHRSNRDRTITATLNPKPVPGDWNGAGFHTNFSTKLMRENYGACVKAAEALGKRHDLHIQNYGEGIERRLTGSHETAHLSKFSYGVSDRTASIRIPWQVARDGKGYIEDRRPNANCDPYVVTRLMMETVCGAEARDK